MDKKSFTDTLHEVIGIMQTSDRQLGKDEVMAYFADIELNEQQKNMIYEYLLKPYEEADGEEKDAGEPGEDGVSKALKLYMEELSDIKSADETPLICELLSGKSEVIDSLIKVYLPKVFELSLEHVHNKVSREDLVQEGNMALFIALKELCGKEEVKISDVRPQVLRAAEQSMAAYATGQMGEDDRQQAIVGKTVLLNEAINLLKEQNLCEPTDEELAADTNMEVSEVAAIRDFLNKTR